MAEMAVSSKNNFYICTVKLYERHEVAARKQRFLCPHFIGKNKRKEWGTGNSPKVQCIIARIDLTAPTALSLFYV